MLISESTKPTAMQNYLPGINIETQRSYRRQACKVYIHFKACSAKTDLCMTTKESFFKEKRSQVARREGMLQRHPKSLSEGFQLSN